MCVAPSDFFIAPHELNYLLEITSFSVTLRYSESTEMTFNVVRDAGIHVGSQTPRCLLINAPTEVQRNRQLRVLSVQT